MINHLNVKSLFVIFSVWLTVFSACNTSTSSTDKTSPANEDKPTFSWKHYCNSRYGFCFDFPSGLIEDLPANADGITASSKDSTFIMMAFANFNVLDQSIKQVYFDKLTSGNFSDTSSVKKLLEADSFTLSGALNDGYYSVEKTILMEGIITSCMVKFSQKTSATYSDIASHIIQSFTLEKAKETVIENSKNNKTS